METYIPNYNFEVVKGDTTEVDFRYLAGGSPADLTGSSVYFECSSPALNQLCEMPVPRSGRFKVMLDGTRTGAVTNINIRYKVLRYAAGLPGPRTTMFSGKFKLKDSTL